VGVLLWPVALSGNECADVGVVSPGVLDAAAVGLGGTIKESTPNTSVYALCISVIREILKERNSAFVKISRDANVASHELARLGRVYHRA
jgi:hypothetical protein